MTSPRDAVSWSLWAPVHPRRQCAGSVITSAPARAPSMSSTACTSSWSRGLVLSRPGGVAMCSGGSDAIATSSDPTTCLILPDAGPGGGWAFHLVPLDGSPGVGRAGSPTRQCHSPCACCVRVVDVSTDNSTVCLSSGPAATGDNSLDGDVTHSTEVLQSIRRWSTQRHPSEVGVTDVPYIAGRIPTWREHQLDVLLPFVWPRRPSS